MPRRLTSKELDFLREGYVAMRVPDLTKEFNARFGHTKSEIAVKAALSYHGFTCGRPTGGVKGRMKLFTEEQVKFISEEYQKLSRSDLTVAFNARFGTAITKRQIVSFIKNHGISCGRSGRFEAGSRPWNTGTKGVMRRNSGTFNKGNVPANTRHMGAERIDSKDGYLLVKVQERNPYTGAETRFKLKHIAVWEEAHGPVPDGYVVRFRDGNKRNCSIVNLFLVTKAVHLRLNQMGYSCAPKEFQDVAVGIAKVECATFARKKG